MTDVAIFAKGARRRENLAAMVKSVATGAVSVWENIGSMAEVIRKGMPDCIVFDHDFSQEEVENCIESLHIQEASTRVITICDYPTAEQEQCEVQPDGMLYTGFTSDHLLQLFHDLQVTNQNDER